MGGIGRTKSRTCDFVIQTGVEGWKFCPPLFVSMCFLQEIRNGLCHILRGKTSVVYR